MHAPFLFHTYSLKRIEPLCSIVTFLCFFKRLYENQNIFVADEQENIDNFTCVIHKLGV